jgi:hypothetical protein
MKLKWTSVQQSSLSTMPSYPGTISSLLTPKMSIYPHLHHCKAIRKVQGPYTLKSHQENMPTSISYQPFNLIELGLLKVINHSIHFQAYFGNKHSIWQSEQDQSTTHSFHECLPGCIMCAQDEARAGPWCSKSTSVTPINEITRDVLYHKKPRQAFQRSNLGFWSVTLQIQSRVGAGYHHSITQMEHEYHPGISRTRGEGVWEKRGPWFS